MMRQQAGESMTVKLSPSEAVEAKTEPWFKQKKGSVFPKKKRLVKSMVLGYIGRSVASLSSACPAISSALSYDPSKKDGCCTN
ncbi:hypothetical protein NC651_005573 [Populus alba x Populus x berolinensis]|nr:hypothetical protein NC651_005573 [Populus alba x Populus x berolinensis]